MNTISAYINAVFLFGSMFGGFTWGVICDKIGRARAVILSTGLYGLFTLLTAFSSSWLLIGIYRFFTGFGVGGILVTVSILVAELWPEKRRAVVIGIVSSGMPVGFIAAGAMNNLLPNWHHAFLAGIVPLTVAVVGAFILPESESWKVINKLLQMAILSVISSLRLHIRITCCEAPLFLEQCSLACGLFFHGRLHGYKVLQAMMQRHRISVASQ